MVKRIVGSLGAWLLLVTLTLAQTSGPAPQAGAAAVPVSSPPSQSVVPVAPLASHSDNLADNGVHGSAYVDDAEQKEREAPCFWVGADFLVWWVRNGPLPIALLTSTSNPTVFPNQGLPGTQVLFGSGSSSGLNFGTFLGGRITAGGWIDPDRVLGVEASGFMLQNNSVSYAASSDYVVPPFVGIPFNLVAPFRGVSPGEASLIGAPFPSTFRITAQSHLYGYEANAVYNLGQSDYLHAELLVGFRSLTLNESLNLNFNLTDAAASSSQSLADSFSTRNNFYGAQVGTRVGIALWRFVIDGAFKVALGNMNNSLTISGHGNVTGTANPFGVAPGNYPGGLFAEPSNIGTYHRNEFSVVPEFQLQTSYAVTNHISCSLGLNVLYATSMLRPGNQIDRNIDLNQNVTLGGTGVVGAFGPYSPQVPFKRSDFWAAGINCGVEYRY